MKHSINKAEQGPFADSIIEAIDKCVHCGLCLPTCPTYQVEQQEMDSPRGRIILMKEVLEGNVEHEDAKPYLDRCLGCVACETACPSKVEYGKLLIPFRDSQNKKSKSASRPSNFQRTLQATIKKPGRFRWALRLGMLARPLAGWMPKSFRPMIDLLPKRMPKRVRLPAVSKPIGGARYRVGLVSGCAQQVLAPQINLATVRILNAAGCEVVVPQRQGCCGALDWHNGDTDNAKLLASKNFDQFPPDLDAIIVNAAGCGSAIREYPLLFRDDPMEEKAGAFQKKAIDISQFLCQIDATFSARLPKPTRVAYQDACHLAHAQGIRSEPGTLLSQVENLELVALQESELCCGSAGTYNLDQPDISAELGRRKAKAVMDSECDLVATGNIGCLIQMQIHLEKLHSKIRVKHWVEIVSDHLNHE